MRSSILAALALAAAIPILGPSRGIGAPRGRQGPATPANTPPTTAEAENLLRRQPGCFVPNLGQWEHKASYVAAFGNMAVFLEAQGWTFTLAERSAGTDRERRVAVKMRFDTAAQPELIAENPLPGVHNYFLGKDPAKWRSEVPRFGSVLYRDLYAGIDLRAREQGGHFEYDLLLHPDAEIESVQVVVEGVERMHIDGEGALVLETALGPVRMPAPPSWEESRSGEKNPIPCRYVLRGKDRFGFEVPDRRPDWALIVDPGLLWSTFVGGSSSDNSNDVALDAMGNPTVVGNTASLDYPTTTGAYSTSKKRDMDGVVARLNAQGSQLVWATYFGGNNQEFLSRVLLDAGGAVTFSGTTFSTDLPIKNAYDGSHNGYSDGFVARLSATGSRLLYSTYLGGTGLESIADMAVDARGALTVTGETNSRDFPTTSSAYDNSINGPFDTYVARISPAGMSLEWSTYLGGSAYDWPLTLAVDAQGRTTVAGWTTSTNFPVTQGAYDTTHNGSSDAFVTRLSSNGSSLVYSTLVGGSAGDGAHAIAVDSGGVTTVFGQTDSNDFPASQGAYDTSHNGGKDLFVFRLSSDGSSRIWATYLGGPGDDFPKPLAVDAQGVVTIAGKTGPASGFPTTRGAYYRGPVSIRHAFVARLSPSGNRLWYSTLIGGSKWDGITGLALDSRGHATVTGSTNSTRFPTSVGAYQTTHKGASEHFVTRFDLLPTGVTAFGKSSPGCGGPLAISVTSEPHVGNAAFSLTCGNAAGSAGTGFLILGAAGWSPPVPVLGIQIWVDPTPPAFLLPVVSNAQGFSELQLPIPLVRTLAGIKVFTQFVWIGPMAPAPCPPTGLSASNALEIIIQP